MKKALYIILFGILGVVVGGVVAWSAELAYLSLLEYESSEGIVRALGYAYGESDPFNYVYIAMAILGLGAGCLQGVRYWDKVYGDRIVSVKRFQIPVIFLYVLLAITVFALAYTNNVFGIKNLFGRVVSGAGEANVVSSRELISGIHGVTLFTDPSCANISNDCSRPYLSSFAVLGEGKVVKIVESTESGFFDTTLPPGDYILQTIGQKGSAPSFSPLLVSVKEGKKTKLELVYSY